MCRKNLFYGGIWIAFGAGMLLGLLIESVLLRFVLGMIASCVGFFFVKG